MSLVCHFTTFGGKILVGSFQGLTASCRQGFITWGEEWEWKMQWGWKGHGGSGCWGKGGIVTANIPQHLWETHRWAGNDPSCKAGGGYQVEDAG